ncbi:MAG: hypothetical protein IPP15_04510 [Saprospiraceae bacterium]|uniref:Uncharacterized protein n=1 Tax=Candidatus Opimibacter skivensis TaxID=2982028 RepID=A0A9D7SSX4_9BACT|nr:hypothetical protein [Candidatus Opimibacter skivensis]
MENVPIYLSLLFEVITFFTVWIFYKSTGGSKKTLVVLLAWLIAQGLIGLTGFYTKTDTLPPRIALLGLPAILFIIGLFTTQRGKQFIDSLDLKTLTLLHTIRVGVELVLLGLFLQKVIPQRMTFEGMNFDILSGLSAPIIYYFGFVRKVLNKKIILIWNFLCLGLLINIVVTAILSAPTPFQQFAFDQPNIAILYFPYVWLPCCVVPLVLLSHLAAIRQLTNNE